MNRLTTQRSRLTAYSLHLRFAAIGSVEKHPGGEVVAEIEEAVLFARRHKQHVAWPERSFLAAPCEAPTAADNDVDFVARMRRLGIVAARRIQLNRQRAVAEQLDVALAVGPRQLIKAGQNPQISGYSLPFDFHGYALRTSATTVFCFHAPTMAPITMQPSNGYAAE